MEEETDMIKRRYCHCLDKKQALEGETSRVIQGLRIGVLMGVKIRLFTVCELYQQNHPITISDNEKGGVAPRQPRLSIRSTNDASELSL